MGRANRSKARELVLWLVVSAGIGSGITFLTCIAASPDPRPDDGARANREMWRWYAAVMVQVGQSGTLPVASDAESQPVRTVKSLFRPKYLGLGLDPTDPWRGQYQLYLDVDGDGYVTVGARKVQARFYMYSVGPNGVDEFGQGDDIGYSHDL